MRTFHPVLVAVLAIALATGLTACRSEEIAARVNGEEISAAELDAQIERFLEQSPQMFEGPEGEARLLDFKRRLLESMIDNVLVRQAAEERGIEVADEEIESQIEDLKASFPSEEDFDIALADANLTLDGLKQQIRDQLATQRLMEELVGSDQVTAAEIDTYYEDHKEDFSQQASTRASHILFDPEDKETAERVLAEIREGADFAELAEEHSKDPVSGAQGGDLGWSDPEQPFVPEFQAALDELEVGEISDLVESDFGWHIIKVEDKREARAQPLDEVSSQIKQLILQQRNIDAYESFLAEIREEAEIEILIEELKIPEDEEVEIPGSEE